MWKRGLQNFADKKKGCESISQQRDNIFAAQGWFRSRAKIPSTWSDLLAMAVTPSFQLRIVHHLKHWIFNFISFEMTYRMHKLNSRKCSKSGWHDWYQECFMADFSLLPLLAYFERLWQRAMELQSLVLHEFELLKALPWTIYSSLSFLDCFGVSKSYQKHQNLTQFD